MSDLIRRSDVIKALRLEYPTTMPMFKELRKEWEIKTEGYRKAEEVIINLPSSQPIEVQKAYYRGKIDGIKECRAMLKKVKEELAKKPEIIRCKDCKHYTLKPQVNSNNCYIRHCTRSALISSKPDDYCSWAERRTDE
jgi:hypothetical protein